MPVGKSNPSEPMELVSLAVPTSCDSMDEMTRVFVEEFLRMGYSPEQVGEFFRDPFYRGPNQVYRARGEEVVGAIIEEAARRWGRRPHQPGGVGTTGNKREVAQ